MIITDTRGELKANCSSNMSYASPRQRPTVPPRTLSYC